VHAAPRTALTGPVRLAGPVALGAVRPSVGAARGRAERTSLVADLLVTIDDLAACIAAPDHPARVGGRVSFAAIADRAVVTEGDVRLYEPDPETGMKRTRYRLAFRGADGALYRLEATQLVRPGRATARERRTAYARLLREAGDACAAPAVVAAGVLVLRLRDLAALLWALRVDGASWGAGLGRLVRFVRHELATPVPALAT
jgi:hypothetical protein